MRARQGAPSEGHPEAARALVRVFREPLDLVEVGTLLRRSTGDPEHAEVACDPAPSGIRVRGGARDVVGHQNGADIDSGLAQFPLGSAEVDHVAGVVAVAEQHPATRLGLPCDTHRLTGGR